MFYVTMLHIPVFFFCLPPCTIPKFCNYGEEEREVEGEHSTYEGAGWGTSTHEDTLTVVNFEDTYIPYRLNFALFFPGLIFILLT